MEVLEVMAKEIVKPTVWDKLKSTNGKIALVIAFFVGYQELMPMLKDVMGFNDDIEAVVQECNDYTNEQIDNREHKAQDVLDIIVSDVDKINQRYVRDSLDYAFKHQKFAVGLRSDANGIVSYRSRHNAECSVRVNRISGQIEYYSELKQSWFPILFEDL